MEQIKPQFSLKPAIKIFTDCLNEAKIFEEPIPYLVVHKGENRITSKLEEVRNLSQEMQEMWNNQDIKQMQELIFQKLNNLPGFQVETDEKGVMAKITDLNNKKSYLVAYHIGILRDDLAKQKKLQRNECEITVNIYHGHIPFFEILFVN